MNKKEKAGQAAASFVKDGMIVGLGTGTTAYYAINAIGDLVKQGMQIKAAATSNATWLQAAKCNIPLLDIDDIREIDLAIDGVDEIDSDYNAIKGGGGALYREKVIASMAKEVIWIMDDSKLVNHIGKFPLPVEVAKFGSKQVYFRLQALGFDPQWRMKDGSYYITDNNNYIIDLHLSKGVDIPVVQRTLDSMTGVLEHGLFLNMCNKIIVGGSDGVRILVNEHKN